MNHRPFCHGLCRAGLILLSLVTILTVSQQRSARTLEEKRIREKLKNDEWYAIPFVGQKMEGNMMLGHKGGSCKGLNGCQINSWTITLDTEHILTAVEIASLSDDYSHIQDIVAVAGSSVNDTKVCGRFKAREVSMGRFYVFCRKPIVGHVIVVQIRRRLMNEQVFQVLTAIKLYALKKTFADDQEIPLNNKYVTQIGDFNYFIADFAVDDNRNTEAVACFPCNGRTEHGFGWWQVDLGGPRTLTRLEIYSSGNKLYSNTLQQTTVGVSHQNTTEEEEFTKCGDFQNTYPMTPMTKINVFCVRPVTGRFVTIRRQRRATFRPDVIVLSEVKLFEKINGRPEILPPRQTVDPRILRKKLLNDEWDIVPLHGVEAAQAGSLANNGPELAIDGDPNTYTVACANCNGARGNLGWWRMTLSSNYEIVAVDILSSRNDLESNYLQEFEVFVIKNKKPRKCAEYNNRTMIPQGAQIVLLCDEPIDGNVVVVRRTANSKFAREKLSIADIEVYSIKKHFDVPEREQDLSQVPKGHPAQLFNKNTDQGGTFSFYISDFAIDGNLETCSISCLSCERGTSRGSGWWKVDLGRTRLISGVQLFPCADEDKASYLQGIRVGVRDTQIASSTYTRCGEITNEVTPFPGSWINVRCARDISGRLVIIKRDASAPRKPDSIAIAEVKVFVKDDSRQEDVVEKESNYLQEFLVRVGGSESHGGEICAEYVERTEIRISTRIYLYCQSPVQGDTVTIERLPNSKFGKDKLAIAEIQFYSRRDESVDPEASADKRLASKEC